MSALETSTRSYGRKAGSSPAENRFYTLIMFDISNRKKYSLLTKLLKRYSRRIQNSVYEAYLKPADIKELTERVGKLMGSERYYNPADRVRIYKVSGPCNAVLYGECADDDADLQQNIFI